VTITRTELKKIRSLRNKKGRLERGLFAAEGVRLLEESLRHQFLPVVIYYTPALLSERGMALVDKFRFKRIPATVISSRQMQLVADARTSQGILGVFPIPSVDLAQLYRRQFRRVLLCESLSDPGNLGTLARSALAFGFELVLLAGTSAEVYSPKVVRASAGAIFGLKVARIRLPELLEFARMEGFKLVAATGNGQTDGMELKSIVDLHKLIVAIGSEAKGLSSGIVENCDLLWRIDHTKAVESLNAAVAGSIIMKQVFDRW